MEGGLVWLGIIAAMLTVALLAGSLAGLRRRNRHRQITDPDLAQATAGLTRHRWIKPPGLHRRR